MLPIYGEHCLSLQAVHNWVQEFSEGRTSSRSAVCCVVPTATTRILRRRFPETCETVGQLFKFVWRLRWKINVVCMSLSAFISFQSWFVTYWLSLVCMDTKHLKWFHFFHYQASLYKFRGLYPRISFSLWNYRQNSHTRLYCIKCHQLVLDPQFLSKQEILLFEHYCSAYCAIPWKTNASHQLPSM